MTVLFPAAPDPAKPQVYALVDAGERVVVAGICPPLRLCGRQGVPLVIGDPRPATFLPSQRRARRHRIIHFAAIDVVRIGRRPSRYYLNNPSNSRSSSNAR